ncbi:hypothetical protein [Nonlabens sp. MB-3u-79]|jgi:hypothetical protein|uniref:hypothetical protein n=1 Tax=Nonlabens sp. MB-3u-79 TaxID=2058134 RepID=UPI0012FE0309|nr:hypothetical protein [Nonlabens sp. MB-3u-79]|tara:strand:+ start:14521 stop:14679 length:159 start_codon:yes stop_codon:yes gene_type:complete
MKTVKELFKKQLQLQGEPALEELVIQIPHAVNDEKKDEESIRFEKVPRVALK